MTAAPLAPNRRALLLALLGLGVFSSGLPAQPAKQVEGHVFAIFALEEMCRDLHFGRGDIGQPGQGRARARLARQQLLLKQLRGRRGLKDEDLHSILDTCDKLYALNAKLSGDIDRTEKESFAPVFAMAKRQQAERQVAAMASTVYLLRGILDPDNADVAFRGMIGVSINEAAREPKRQQDLRRLWVDRRQVFDDAAASALRTYHKEYKALLDAERKAIGGKLSSLAKRYRWKETVAFDPDWDAAKGRLRDGDPFRTYHKVSLRVASPGFGKEEKKAGAGRLQAAKELLAAAALFPPGEPYTFYRASMLFEAGRLANDSAMQQLGPVGFTGSREARPDAAEAALEAWNAYYKIETMDRGAPGEVLHHFLLAHANSGSKKAQRRVYDMVNNRAQPQIMNLLVRSRRPSLLYDYARLCAICDNKAQALHFLQLAAQHGFDKAEEAKVSPDLKSLPSDLVDAALARGARLSRTPPPKRR